MISEQIHGRVGNPPLPELYERVGVFAVGGVFVRGLRDIIRNGTRQGANSLRHGVSKNAR